jgi:RNA polymerase sigma-70 factor (ECF subfamily)
MERDDLNQHLSQISTVWTVLRQAHAGPPDAAAAAQQLLMERYGGAVHRYLLGILRDRHAADDLTQEFALKLVRGEFKSADPQRGRFRYYIKAALFHLISRYRKKQQRQPRSLSCSAPEPAGPDTSAEDSDRRFLESWRHQLLTRTWEALAQAQPVYHAVLHFRAEHPKMASADMARQLSCQLDKPLTADGVRQALHRARDRFAQLLLDEVAQSLEFPRREEVEEELRDLNLLAYCQPALARSSRGG